MDSWGEYRAPEYRATTRMFKDFLEGAVWHDIRLTLEQALEMTRGGLEKAASWDATLRLQQDADCLKRFLEMPRVIMEDLEVTEEKEAARESQSTEMEDYDE